MTLQTIIQACVGGYVERSDRTPEEILNTCKAWNDGKLSAMHRFWSGERVQPTELEAEASAARRVNLLGPEEDGRLKGMEIWALREQALSRFYRELQQASVNFNAVLETQRFDPLLAAQLWASATGRLE